VGPLIGLALFIGAVWVLRHELQAVTLGDIALQLHAIPPVRAAASLAITVLGYLVFTAYDLIALRQIGRSVPLRQVMVTAFVAYAFANSIPLSFVVGGTVRYRFYAGWRVDAGDTAALVLFNVLTYSLGLATAAALAFIIEPGTVPRLLSLPFTSTRPLGVTALILVLAYLGWSARGRTLRLGRKKITPPRPAISLFQIGISLADWMLSGAALFVLLPGEGLMSYPGFFGVFILGQIAALITQLPGGLGVFEAVMLATLTPELPPAAVFGALLLYRAIYFLLPLALAIVILGVREIRRGD
jgi:uncharacterized membrane protein YbhN (UPF0104 family)